MIIKAMGTSELREKKNKVKKEFLDPNPNLNQYLKVRTKRRNQ